MIIVLTKDIYRNLWQKLWKLMNVWRPLYCLFTDLGCKTWEVTCVAEQKNKSYKSRCNHLSVSVSKKVNKGENTPNYKRQQNSLDRLFSITGERDYDIPWMLSSELVSGFPGCCFYHVSGCYLYQKWVSNELANILEKLVIIFLNNDSKLKAKTFLQKRNFKLAEVKA